jgi:GMP synthase (glutamine-hydrolysing)
VLIVNSAERGVTQFLQPVQQLLSQINIIAEVGEYSDCIEMKPDRYDAVILTASPCGDDIVDHHLPYYKWITFYQRPLLGICAGHQIVARFFGATLVKRWESEKGNQWITIDHQDPFFNGCGHKLLVRQNHHDAVTLPENFIRLAYSDKCRVQAMRHKSKPYYTTQFHAEITNAQLIFNFIEIATALK